MTAGNLPDQALALARVFTAGGRLIVSALDRPDHARHVAVEFVHPAITGARSLSSFAIAPEDIDHVDWAVDLFEAAPDLDAANLGQVRVGVDRQDVVTDLGELTKHAIAELRLVRAGADHGDGLHGTQDLGQILGLVVVYLVQ